MGNEPAGHAQRQLQPPFDAARSAAAAPLLPLDGDAEPGGPAMMVMAAPAPDLVDVLFAFDKDKDDGARVNTGFSFVELLRPPVPGPADMVITAGGPAADFTPVAAIVLVMVVVVVEVIVDFAPDMLLIIVAVDVAFDVLVEVRGFNNSKLAVRFKLPAAPPVPASIVPDAAAPSIVAADRLIVEAVIFMF